MAFSVFQFKDLNHRSSKALAVSIILLIAYFCLPKFAYGRLSSDSGSLTCSIVYRDATLSMHSIVL